ncbi:MAG: hypothetical protein ACL93V_04830 [Candidatus Electrothrix sp. YB6]
MRKKIMFSLLCGIMLILPGSAFAGDAAKVADYIARSSVRTIYKNMRAEGISWEQIRDQYMPGILNRSLRSIRRDYSRTVILDEFLPTLVNSYYSEIDRINREHSTTCMDSGFIVATMVPFIQACETSLGSWRITVTQVIDVLLDVSYPYQVCKVSEGKSCSSRVQEEFTSAFNYNAARRRYRNVCSEQGWL